MTACIQANAIIPIRTDFSVSSGKQTDWESYRIHIKNNIYNKLKTTNKEGLDWTWVADTIANSIIEKHKTQLDSNWLVRRSRNFTVLVDDYINRNNRTLLSYYGSFTVTEKNETFTRDWSIKISGNFEIKFLYLNLELLKTLEETLMAVPREKLLAARSTIFDRFLDY
ncbi:hypothetical protein BGZ97_006381 [Linnemannia gamsii]|uniref:Uncharacterized protein n=1 Tax=Linnemannia gamsii TaxID=64522 RepID=A0A9P6QU84_9FUNG|nr:hypothetical protein BGZ97_006381 [Linnemannia gamsii]